MIDQIQQNQQMNSFWPQKQQINCTCFNVLPKNDRKIFRSQAYSTTNQPKKQLKEHSIKSQSEQNKSKKKSLKKQKNPSPLPSEKFIKQKQDISKPTFIDIPITTTPNQIKKIQKTIVFDYLDSQKANCPRSQRAKHSHSYRLGRGSSNMTLQPVNFECQKEFELSKNRSNLYFQQVINKQMIKQQNRPFLYKDQFDFIEKKYVKPQIAVQILTNNLQKLKLQTIDKKFQNQISQKVSSFRNSAITARQKENHNVKKTGRMEARQIQSEDDGNSIESDQISEVVARGWDGLTQQKLQIEELQKINKKQDHHAQTMVTQESNIQASQIKTFTEYSNSLISPKSQKTNMLPFGGYHKYGLAGMSYQNIQDLGKKKGSYLKFNF